MAKHFTRIQGPRQTSLHGKTRGHTVSVCSSKPPKLRFQPGTIVKYEGTMYEVLYVYRVQSNEHEWIYALEERSTSGALVLDQIGTALAGMGCGSETPRICYDVFRDGCQAHDYFADIPANGDREHVKNGDMLRKAVVVKSDG